MLDLTKPKSLDSFDLAALFNLKEGDIQSINIHHQEETVYVYVTLNVSPSTCPVCDSSSIRIKDYREKKILHSLLTNYPCFIIYRSRRHVCSLCGKTFYEHNPFTHSNMKISVLTVCNVLQDLKNVNETFASTANRYHLSASTVSYLFDSHVAVPRKKLPSYLCIDECFAFSGAHGNYVCVLVDFQTKQLVDLLPSRKKDDLIRYFDAIPLEERKQVKLMATDMWETYRAIAKLKLPNAKVAVDKFHVLQEMTRKITKVRIRCMNQGKRPKVSAELKELARRGDQDAKKEIYKLQVAEESYYLLKKFHWLLTSGEEKRKATLNVNAEKRMNRKLKRYLNYYDIYTLIMKAYPVLDDIHDFKVKLDNFYRNSKENDAKENLDKLIQEMLESSIVEVQEFARTLGTWRREIINSFIVVDKVSGRKMSNGIIENRNKSLKLLKHNANGYTNWKRFRNRAMYALNDDATYHLNPIENNHSKKGF